MVVGTGAGEAELTERGAGLPRGGGRRVLLVGRGTPERGGIPTFLRLVDHGLRASTDVVMVNLARPQLREGGRASARNVLRTLTDTWHLARLVRRGDVVHLSTALAPGVTFVRAGLLAAVGRARGARVLVHAHGGAVVDYLSRGQPRRLLGRACLAPAHRIAAVSTGVQQALAPVCGPGRVVLVDNAIDVGNREARPQRNSPPRVLFAGGLTPRKGVLDLIAASEALHDRGVEHELWLAGGTPDEGSEAEDLVRRQAGDRVRFLGPLPPERMPALYAEVDVFCLPSWYEAMPLSVLEAMAAGLPVVATDVGDIGRAVEDGVTGVVVQPRDPAALARALQLVLADPVRAEAMGDAGRRVVEERFSLPILTSRLLRLYDELEVGA